MAKLQTLSAALPSPRWLFFFFPVMSTDCLPVVQCPERGWKGLVPPFPAGPPSFRWIQECLPAFGAEDKGREYGGWGGAGDQVWNTLSAGQLVNFVGMHLVERRCINIRSLPVYCVSCLAKEGLAGPRCLSSRRQGWLQGDLRRLLLAHRPS